MGLRNRQFKDIRGAKIKYLNFNVVIFWNSDKIFPRFTRGCHCGDKHTPCLGPCAILKFSKCQVHGFSGPGNIVNLINSIMDSGLNI